MFDQEDNLVAFCRVLTDYIFKATIFDVIVSKPYQGKKIGGFLVHTIISHKDLINVKHKELYCLKEMAPFYAKYGFKTVDIVFMRIEKPSEL